MSQYTRRDFLKFLGKSTAFAATISPLSMLSACGSEKESVKQANLVFSAIEPSLKDELGLMEGMQYDIIAQYGDAINASQSFGFNNDYLAFFPLDNKKNEGLLWVNHEYCRSLFINGYKKGKDKRTLEQVQQEQAALGGSIIHIKQQESKWTLVKDSAYNRRLDGNSEIPFAAGIEVVGTNMAKGTFGNCAGGVTPWGTVLTCEENYNIYYGEVDYTKSPPTRSAAAMEWDLFEQRPPEHYGWVVEVNPLTGEAKKHTSIGRFMHECATVIPLEDGRVVVYSGDDTENEHVYKFIGSKPNSLEEGMLYVANFEEGKWVPLDYDKNEMLQKHFKSKIEMLVRTREAAKLLGGTPCNRPEDIEINPNNGDVLISMTNNTLKGDFHGAIVKIIETDGKYDSLTFKSDTFLAGGETTMFSCPDNLAFDPAGNLWFTTDISGSKVGKGKYAPYKNNALFYVPLSGEQAGEVIRVANAPVDAEFTGPYFTEDGKHLFLSVQHPGETSRSIEPDALTSHWPKGGKEMPLSAVVVLSGPLLEKMTSLK